MRRIRKCIWNPSHPYLHFKNSTWNLFLSCNMLILRQRVSHKTQHFKGSTLTRAIQLLNENPRDSRNWSMHKEQNFTPTNCLLSHRGAQGGWDLYFYSRQTHTVQRQHTQTQGHCDMSPRASVCLPAFATVHCSVTQAKGCEKPT